MLCLCSQVTRRKLGLTLHGALLELKSIAERQLTRARARHCANEATRISDEHWRMSNPLRARAELSRICLRFPLQTCPYLPHWMTTVNIYYKVYSVLLCVCRLKYALTRGQKNNAREVEQNAKEHKVLNSQNELYPFLHWHRQWTVGRIDTI